MHQYDAVLDDLINDRISGIENFPCVIPNWDNTPRNGLNGLVLHQSTPEGFRKQVRRAVDRMRDVSSEHRIVFIKSWNEWAEGNHLEPDLRFGLGYLEVLHEELMRS